MQLVQVGGTEGLVAGSAGGSLGWERAGPDSILARARPPPAATELELASLSAHRHCNKVFDLTRGDGRRWSPETDRRPGCLAPSRQQRQPTASTNNVHWRPLPLTYLLYSHTPLAGDFNRPCPNPPFRPQSRPSWICLLACCCCSSDTSAHNHMPTRTHATHASRISRGSHMLIFIQLPSH